VILGFLAMLVANVAVTLGAISITRRISSGRRSLDAVLFFLIRYLIIAAAILGTGLAHLLSPLPLGILGAAGLALWAASGEHRRLPSFPRPELGWLLWALIAMIVGRLLWQVWWYAPYSVDPLSYHLPKMAQWVQQGALLPYPRADIRETFPAGFELLETWWCVFLHHDVLIEMAGVEFLALGAAAVAALARYSGLGLRSSAFAAVLYAVTPAPLLQATACMNDAPVASVMLATLALCATRSSPLLVLAAAAIGVGIKPTFAFVLPGIVLLAFLERRSTPLPPPSRAWGIPLLALSLAVGSFWYVLNLVRFGNPLYPIGSVNTVEKASLSAIEGASLPLRLNDLVGGAIYDARDHYTVQFILVAGWGIVMFACGGVALVAMLRTNGAIRKLAAAFGLTLLVALQLAPWGSFYLRFILFFPALGAIAAAALAGSLPRGAPVLWVTCALCLLSTTRPGDLRTSTLETLSSSDWHERTIDRSFVWAVPSDATIACLQGTHDDSNGEGYLAYGPGLSRKVVFLPRVESVEDLVRQMNDHEAFWLFPQARNGDGSSRRHILQAVLREVLSQQWSTPIYSLRRH